jgi:prepilin-type N-terminal cleavage/methylation domain-containing protein
MKARKGFSLIEVSVAVALIGITAVGLATGLGIASKTLLGMDTQETAKDLAAAQMEYIQSLPYDSANNPPVYQVISGLSTKYPGYSIVTPMASRLDPKGDGTGNDDGVQRITIVVMQGSKAAYTLTGEKVLW